MSDFQKAFSSRFKRKILDMKITKFLPFVCLETAFEYRQWWWYVTHNSKSDLPLVRSHMCSIFLSLRLRIGNQYWFWVMQDKY